jgi:diguanylate cyclase (GGDEF)-like protein
MPPPRGRTSVHRLNTNLHPADALAVLRRADTRQLRRDLASSRARVADLEAQLRDRNRLDPRTRLLSLDAFRAAAGVALRRTARDDRPVALALVDIDGFRVLNARRGVEAGDAALRALAARLRRLVRADDILARTGADEIAVLMPGSGLAGAEACCARLMAALADTEVPGAGSIAVSAGVAAATGATTVDALLADAAAGLDLARAEGGARVAAAPEEPGTPAPRHADVIEALSTALLERDRYTGEHSAEVVELVREVARAMRLSEPEVERIAAAALVHDVGKVAIPDRILHKPAALDDAEWAVMREHPVVGERILRTIPGMGAVARIVRHEHERFDGGGYPDGLAGDAIPVGSRIILACDAYHAMTSDRPYRRAMDDADAVAELARGAGTQFDPRVVAALLGRVAAGLRRAQGTGAPTAPAGSTAAGATAAGATPAVPAAAGSAP